MLVLTQIGRQLELNLEEVDMAQVKLSEVFSNVSENITLNRYENGWMVEVSGNDHEDHWQNKKFIFSDLKNVLTFVEEYSKIKLSQEKGVTNMDMIEIQLQDQSGNWRTYSYTQNIPLRSRDGMRQLQWQFPDARIRAVDSNGRVVDIF